jgi:hypothetical protein
VTGGGAEIRTLGLYDSRQRAAGSLGRAHDDLSNFPKRNEGCMRCSTGGDATHDAFVRHFSAQKGAGVAAMRHCFGPKRRANRRDGEKACWRRGLGVAHQCTEVAHGDASRGLRKFVLVAEKSPEIRKLAGNSRLDLVGGPRRDQKFAVIFQDRRHQFTDIVGSVPFFLVRLPGGRPRPRLTGGCGTAGAAAGTRAGAGSRAAPGSSGQPKSCTRRTRAASLSTRFLHIFL